MENRTVTSLNTVSADNLILDNIELAAKLMIAENEIKKLSGQDGYEISADVPDSVLSDEELLKKVTEFYSIGNGGLSGDNVRALNEKVAVLNEKYNEKSKAHVEACRKYREALIRYDKLKEQYNAQSAAASGKLHGLRKIAYTYSLFGFRGLCRKIIGKIKGSKA